MCRHTTISAAFIQSHAMAPYNVYINFSIKGLSHKSCLPFYPFLKLTFTLFWVSLSNDSIKVEHIR